MVNWIIIPIINPIKSWEINFLYGLMYGYKNEKPFFLDLFSSSVWKLVLGSKISTKPEPSVVFVQAFKNSSCEYSKRPWAGSAIEIFVLEINKC